MSKKLWATIIFVAGIVTAVVFFVRSPHAMNASKAAMPESAAAGQASDRAQPTGHPSPSPATPSPAIDPTRTGLPSRNALRLPDPEGRGKGPLGEKAQKDPHGTAQAMYDAFVARAELSPTQRAKFDQIMRDIHAMDTAESKAAAKDPNHPLTLEGFQNLERESFDRVKAILTPEQYQVFNDEIGNRFFFVINFAQPK